jgi:hypothetical protein
MRSCDTLEFDGSDLCDEIWRRLAPFVPARCELRETDERWQHDLEGNWEARGLNSHLLVNKYLPGGHFAPHADGSIQVCARRPRPALDARVVSPPLSHRAVRGGWVGGKRTATEHPRCDPRRSQRAVRWTHTSHAAPKPASTHPPQNARPRTCTSVAPPTQMVISPPSSAAKTSSPSRGGALCTGGADARARVGPRSRGR